MSILSVLKNDDKIVAQAVTVLNLKMHTPYSFIGHAIEYLEKGSVELAVEYGMTDLRWSVLMWPNWARTEKERSQSFEGDDLPRVLADAVLCLANKAKSEKAKEETQTTPSPL